MIKQDIITNFSHKFTFYKKYIKICINQWVRHHIYVWGNPWVSSQFWKKHAVSLLYIYGSWMIRPCGRLAHVDDSPN